jgi:sugar O-acyltransferase (sialic acid O-acetyltransferase NeuD family)
VKRLAILGASGHGKVIADTAVLLGWSVVFFDDAWPSITVNSHWSVIGTTNELLHEIASFDGVIIAIGNNSIRLKKFKQLFSTNAKLISLVHPSAIVSQYTSIGLGSFVGAGAVLQVDCKVGLACIVNTNAVIEHDCSIFDGVHVSPSASLAGGVSVGSESWIGISACVKQLVKVGSNVIVGAGSVVIGDVSNQQIVVGSPAKPLITE